MSTLGWGFTAISVLNYGRLGTHGLSTPDQVRSYGTVPDSAGCVAFYARRYLNRHELPTEGLAVEADFRMGSRPARVALVEVCLTIPAEVPVERREALLAVASLCTVHNSLITAPEISVAFSGGPGRPNGNP